MRLVLIIAGVLRVVIRRVTLLFVWMEGVGVGYFPRVRLVVVVLIAKVLALRSLLPL